jgi:hypothetical protein
MIGLVRVRHLRLGAMGAQIRKAGPIDRASKDIPSEKNDLERG